MTTSTRIQLSLYVPPPWSAGLEAVRLILDPVQSRLIPAHVTLCREDELAEIEPERLGARLAEAGAASVTLCFGRPQVFAEHGILLPCIAGEPQFRALRKHVLRSRTMARGAPHLTLAHPRNPKASGNDLANASALPDDLTITFETVRLIEQTGSTPWRVLEVYGLRGR